MKFTDDVRNYSADKEITEEGAVISAYGKKQANSPRVAGTCIASIEQRLR